MSATNTPNQGFPLAQLGDSPCQLPTTFAALAAAADQKANQLDVDQARVGAPNMVKISCSLGYLYANDTALVGMQFDTVEFNRGTPTDLSVFNGLLVNRGLWFFGAEVVLVPVASLGNGRDVIQTLSVFTGVSDPFSAPGTSRVDMATAIQTNGFPNLFTPPIWGYPNQYLNGGTLGLAPTDNFQAQMKGLSSVNVPYATIWAVQLGDL